MLLGSTALVNSPAYSQNNGNLTRHVADKRYYRHTYSPHQCWFSVVNGGPTLFQHWVNVSCLLESGYSACSRQRADQASPVLNIGALSMYTQYTSLLVISIISPSSGGSPGPV